MMPVAANPDERWLHRVGALSALVIGISYIAILPRFARVGVPPTNGEIWLKYLQGKSTIWWTILALCVLTDFLFVPLALSLYVALQQVSKNAMLLAMAFVGLFVGLDLAVTWTNYASLLSLSSSYAAATNDVQRAGCIAAANYASAVLAARSLVFYSIVDLALAIFIIGFVMLKENGTFSKTTAYLGVAAGFFGIVSATGFFVAVIVHAILVTVWIFFVGDQLFRFSQRCPEQVSVGR
jgi:hypothetical protein